MGQHEGFVAATAYFGGLSIQDEIMKLDTILITSLCAGALINHEEF